jgi:hypothetical protein
MGVRLCVAAALTFLSKRQKDPPTHRITLTKRVEEKFRKNDRKQWKKREREKNKEGLRDDTIGCSNETLIE